jgi:hypothetical protein
MVHIYNGVLASNKKNEIMSFFKKINGTGDHCVKGEVGE